MAGYKVKDVSSRGSPYALAMLLRALDSGESFVRYGEIKNELERQLGIDSIFTVQIGTVAGAMMDDILRLDPNAPLINVLICRSNGIPGRGAAGYLAKRYGDNTLNDWNQVPTKRKRELIQQERQKILAYPNWYELSERLYAKLPELMPKPSPVPAQDYNPAHGGEPESEEHKALKAWVLRNPKRLGIYSSPDYAKAEEMLLSGDEVDVMFRCGHTFYVVEVKSRRSNAADFRRGIYQCVKYKEVKLAEQLPSQPKVIALLVTESQIPNELVERAKLLGVEWRAVTIS